jgi:hypothetical protein
MNGRCATVTGHSENVVSQTKRVNLRDVKKNSRHLGHNAQDGRHALPSDMEDEKGQGCVVSCQVTAYPTLSLSEGEYSEVGHEAILENSTRS